MNNKKLMKIEKERILNNYGITFSNKDMKKIIKLTDKKND